MEGISTSERSEGDDVVFTIEGPHIPAALLLATSFAHTNRVDADRVVLHASADNAGQVRRVLEEVLADPPVSPEGDDSAE